jgi:hypothetical protein
MTNPDKPSQPFEVHSFSQRLEKLERDNRNLKRTVLAMGLILLALLTMAQVRPVARVIEAEKFVLRDSSGKESATFGMSQTGPELKIHNSDATPGSFTSIGSGIIRIEDEQGFQTAIGVTDLERTRNGYKLHDAGQPSAGEIHKTSAASITIFDKDKTVTSYQSPKGQRITKIDFN